jgi:hypothetical protein
MLNTKSIHEQAIEQIILATEAAHAGRQAEVSQFCGTAQNLAELNARRLRAQGQHQAADAYVLSLNEHVSRVKGILSSKASRAENVSKAKVILNTLEKGFDNPFVSASMARREHMATGQVKSTMTVGGVKPQKGYNYKPIHELHPDDQSSVQSKFAGDYARYAYATHPDTGRLAHAMTGRVPLQPGQAVRAQSSSFKELKPEHKRGAFVKINKPGHPSHEKKGIVLGPHPELPGKIRVQVGHTEAHSVYVDHNEVALSKPASKVEKALQTIYNIRKAFMKV